MLGWLCLLGIPLQAPRSPFGGISMNLALILLLSLMLSCLSYFFYAVVTLSVSTERANSFFLFFFLNHVKSLKRFLEKIKIVWVKYDYFGCFRIRKIKKL